MIVKFERRVQLTPDVWEYYFVPERPLGYVSGQYVDVHLPNVSDPRGPSRVFTLTSLPDEPFLSFAAKFSAPLTPYKLALQNLQPGDAAHIDDAMGDVILPKNPSIPLIFVAGGLGIASFVSILRSLQQGDETRSITLLYALRTAQDDAYPELLKEFTFANKHVFICPNRLIVDDITQIVTEDSLIYLSGSQRFVEGLRTSLQANGIDHEQIIFDFFDGYSEL